MPRSACRGFAANESTPSPGTLMSLRIVLRSASRSPPPDAIIQHPMYIWYISVPSHASVHASSACRRRKTMPLTKLNFRKTDAAVRGPKPAIPVASTRRVTTPLSKSSKFVIITSAVGCAVSSSAIRPSVVSSLSASSLASRNRYSPLARSIADRRFLSYRPFVTRRWNVNGNPDASSAARISCSRPSFEQSSDTQISQSRKCCRPIERTASTTNEVRLCWGTQIEKNGALIG